MSKLHIMKTSHGYHVKIPSSVEKGMIAEFCKRYTDYEEKWNPVTRKLEISPKTVYATANKDRTIYSFLLSSLEKFYLFVEAYGFNSKNIIVETLPAPKANRSFDWKLTATPRENQIEAIKFLGGDSNIRVLPLPTGQGKTLSTLLYCAERKEPAIFFMKSGNMKAWIDELSSKSNIDKKDIVVVKGAAQLGSVVERAKHAPLNDQPNVFLISTTTFNEYLNFWIHGARSNSSVIFETFMPHEFFEIMGVSLCVTDEAHEVLHQVVRRAIMLNVDKQIYLSATLDSSSSHKNFIYETIYPHVDRFTKYKENNHVHVIPYYYGLNDPDKVRYKGAMGYHHATYEKYLLLRKKLAVNYFNLIYKIFETDYLVNRRPGTKILVLMGTVDMCEAFTTFLKEKMSEHKDISIDSYTASTDDSVLDNTEVIVSTPGSCGTGTDIPNLIICINTVAVNSKEQIVQIQGRTRPVKLYPEVLPRFYYLACRHIDRHLVYDKNHQHNFIKRSKEITPTSSGLYV